MQQLVYELLHAYAAVGVAVCVCSSWCSSMREQGAAHASLRAEMHMPTARRCRYRMHQLPGDAYTNCLEMHKPTARRCRYQLPGDADTRIYQLRGVFSDIVY
jgi:hypothetical protein